MRWLSGEEVVSASTDSTLRLWSARSLAPVRTFAGHINEKNFVGLGVDSEFVACGSESNEVRHCPHGALQTLLDLAGLENAACNTVVLFIRSRCRQSQLLKMQSIQGGAQALVHMTDAMSAVHARHRWQDIN